MLINSRARILGLALYPAHIILVALLDNINVECYTYRYGSKDHTLVP